MQEPTRTKRRMLCMQLSVAAARWPDDMLQGAFIKPDGQPTTGEESRRHLLQLKEDGYKVVPCGEHKCNAAGVCQGEPST